MPTLKELRKAAYLSQKEASEKVGVTTSTISNWERGIKKPSISHTRKLAESYGVAPQAISEAIEETEQNKGDTKE